MGSYGGDVGEIWGDIGEIWRLAAGAPLADGRDRRARSVAEQVDEGLVGLLEARALLLAQRRELLRRARGQGEAALGRLDRRRVQAAQLAAEEAAVRRGVPSEVERVELQQCRVRARLA